MLIQRVNRGGGKTARVFHPRQRDRKGEAPTWGYANRLFFVWEFEASELSRDDRDGGEGMCKGFKVQGSKLMTP